MNRIFLLLVTMIVLSCTSKEVLIYKHDNTKNDDGEIFGSNLKPFFNKNPNIYTVSINSKKISKKLLLIKEEIETVNNNVNPDDRYYEYAFIVNKKDTLYTDYRLEFWRYGNNEISYKLDDVTKETIISSH
ncbi:hypothetical protein SAMN05421786_1173 [Chryseobacterium ureilyticum]|uniref:Lipoprotein n=1 Tax=Chryseobacterium ureilyticum TaxID=373668 RepID=A0A1N7QSV6_9FLAO|nr:hypothetical protein [Chryseobacterium ureilyticum]SIT25982.1 hypothetical protein SAMN05421786_1173 [Chryseobacterium ureilyticum]